MAPRWPKALAGGLVLLLCALPARLGRTGEQADDEPGDVPATAGPTQQTPEADPAGVEPAADAREALPPDEGPEVIDVVVQGARPTAPRPADPTPASYVLRGRALELPGLTVADALATVPGVQTTRSGGPADLATASVRGASSAQTPIYLAGLRLNDDLTGTVDVSTIPLWMLHRIEIYRGTAPSHADRLGVGGAIFFEPALPSGRRVGAALAMGSFGEREGRASLMLGGGQGSAMLALRHHSGNGDYTFVDDGGTRFDDSDDVVRRRVNADHSELDAWTVGRINHGDSRLVMVAGALSRTAGAPGLQLRGARSARARRQRWLTGVSGQTPCAHGSGSDVTACALELSTGLLVTRYGLADPLGELGPERHVALAGERLTQRLRLKMAPDSWLRLRVGGSQELGLLRIDTDGTSHRARRHVLRSDVSALAELGDQVQLSGVGAVECHSTAAGTEDQTCGVLEPVGRLGARWQIIDWLSVLGNVGRYVRVPTLGELHGISSVVRGNPDLLVEEAIAFDLGVTGHWGSDSVAFYGQLFGFTRFTDELIAYRRSSFGSIRPYNAGTARVLGAELTAGGTAWGVLHGGLSVTVLDPRDVTEGRSVVNDLLPHQSRLVVAPMFELVAPPFAELALDRATIGLRYRHRSSRVADPAGLIVIEADGQLDLDGGLAFLDRRLAFRWRLSNLLDQRAYDLVGYPLPGRAGHVLLEAWW
ncbi:MAG: TonB-dependent receptor [Deltaproteobacteria bacterium]|nr:TonB-dependent receptor [Deltaproteobacteria bacterium]